jgi:hypothetical protein
MFNFIIAFNYIASLLFIMLFCIHRDNTIMTVAFLDCACKTEGIIPVLMLNAWTVWMCFICLICHTYVPVLTRPACCVNCMLSSSIRSSCKLFQVYFWPRCRNTCMFMRREYRQGRFHFFHWCFHLGGSPCDRAYLLSFGLCMWDLFSPLAFTCHFLSKESAFHCDTSFFTPA